MNAGNAMVAVLSWLLAILRGPSSPSAPSLAPGMISLPLCILAFCPISCELQTHPWLVAMCRVRQSWLSVLTVLLLLPIPKIEIAQAQPSPQRSNRHSPFLFSTWLWWSSIIVAEKEDKMSSESVSHFQGLPAWARKPAVCWPCWRADR